MKKSLCKVVMVVSCLSTALFLYAFGYADEISSGMGQLSSDALTPTQRIEAPEMPPLMVDTKDSDPANPVPDETDTSQTSAAASDTIKPTGTLEGVKPQSADTEKFPESVAADIGQKKDTECVDRPDGYVCKGDGSVCIENRVCMKGSCVGTPVSCPDYACHGGGSCDAKAGGCVYEKTITACDGGKSDGCCPAGCDESTDADCPVSSPVCGNNVQEGGEECDNTSCPFGMSCSACRCVALSREIETVETRPTTAPSSETPALPVGEQMPSDEVTIAGEAISICDGASDIVKELNEKVRSFRNDFKGDLFCDEDIARVVIVFRFPMADPSANAALVVSSSLPDVSALPFEIMQASGGWLFPASSGWKSSSVRVIERPVLLAGTGLEVLASLRQRPFSESSFDRPPAGFSKTEGFRQVLGDNIATFDVQMMPVSESPISLTLGDGQKVELSSSAAIAPLTLPAVYELDRIVSLVLPAEATFTGVEGGDGAQTQNAQNVDAVFVRLKESQSFPEDLPWDSRSSYRFVATQQALSGIQAKEVSAQILGYNNEFNSASKGCSLISNSQGISIAVILQMIGMVIIVASSLVFVRSIDFDRREKSCRSKKIQR